MPIQDGRQRLDLLIIGAGPAGLSAADCAAREGLSYLVVEKGLIADTVYHYPVGLTVFSTTNELELREGTLQPCREKPTREELLTHYVRFAIEQNLRINTGEEVLSIERDKTDSANDSRGERDDVRENVRDDVRESARKNVRDEVRGDAQGFVVRTSRAEYAAARVLVAFGAMAHRRRLNVPGEELPKVRHRFDEPYPYVRKDALVVGGGNSAAEAALFLSEGGARTTLAIWRADWENRDPKRGAIKHWVREPLERQLERGNLSLLFFTEVEEITAREVRIKREDGASVNIPNDAVFVLIGADADFTLLRQVGVEIAQAGLCEVPVYDPTTFETNVSGLYVAGHVTLARHIKAAIEVPRRIVPLIAQSLRAAV